MQPLSLQSDSESLVFSTVEGNLTLGMKQMETSVMHLPEFVNAYGRMFQHLLDSKTITKIQIGLSFQKNKKEPQYNFMHLICSSRKTPILAPKF